MKHNTLKYPGVNWPWWNYGWQKDVALALVLGAVEILAAFVIAHFHAQYRPFDAGAIVLLGVGAAALIFRRQYPAAVLVFATAATLLYWVLDYPRGPVFLVLIVAFVTAVISGRRLLAWIVLAVGYATFLWLPYLVSHEPAPGTSSQLALAGWLLLLGAASEIARVRRERIVEAKHTREEAARRRASEERLRIARELHDVVGHHISLISVQAGVALHLMDEHPEQARTSLTAIRQASKDALRDLRSVLDVLRQAGEEPLRYPSPSLACLDDLVVQAAAGGLEVRTEVVGDPGSLPASVDMAAYRIVQEALTNVIRHAGRATATVLVTIAPLELTVQIDDNGVGPAAQGKTVAGHGILGMQERAAALGGTIEAGPRPGGGFRVFARLPLEAVR